ncbi:MAG: metallophosphoesterase family protein [Leptolinea sp.]|jgi:putative phosphoesterase|nr:metallophosphoesterase family protein [Leptolinea sp.]
MKVALLSDVHGNLQALEAVLSHAGEMKIKQIWNLGDFTGFGACPEQVIQVLKKRKAVSIIGNYDQKVLKIPRKMDEWKETKIPEKWFAFHWSYQQLSKKSIDYLKSLPETYKENVKHWKVLFTHGSPESNEEALNDETPQERLRDLAHRAHANIILCGHSHKPFMRFAGGSIFINPGSVGRPFDGDPRASYAVLSIKKQKVEVDFFRIEYDVEKAAGLQIEAGLPPEFAEMTRRGISLDDLAREKSLSQSKPEDNDSAKSVHSGKKVEAPDESVEVTREVVQTDEPEKKNTRRRKPAANDPA